jgi:hypothetical protein
LGGRRRLDAGVGLGGNCGCGRGREVAGLTCRSGRSNCGCCCFCCCFCFCCGGFFRGDCCVVAVGGRLGCGCGCGCCGCMGFGAMGTCSFGCGCSDGMTTACSFAALLAVRKAAGPCRVKPPRRNCGEMPSCGAAACGCRYCMPDGTDRCFWTYAAGPSIMRTGGCRLVSSPNSLSTLHKASLSEATESRKALADAVLYVHASAMVKCAEICSLRVCCGASLTQAP